MRTIQLGPDIIRHDAYAIASMPLGFVYLFVFVYLGFSSNVVAFAKGQRVPGKGFSAVRVVLLCALALGGLAAMRPLALYWRSVEEKSALAFAEESVRAISAHWAPAAFDERADPQYVADWPVEAKKSFLQSLSRFGASRTLGEPRIRALGSFDVDHGLRWHCGYAGDEIFEHGNATMTLELEHGVFTPWRITSWSLRPNDPNPPPTP